VGKSTLFNRFIMERKAIVDNESGVTRDRHYGNCVWNGVTFTVIDTGGYVSDSDDVFESAIREQVHIAIEEADILLFMADSYEGSPTRRTTRNATTCPSSSTSSTWARSTRFPP
jgi:GTPase